MVVARAVAAVVAVARAVAVVVAVARAMAITMAVMVRWRWYCWWRWR